MTDDLVYTNMLTTYEVATWEKLVIIQVVVVVNHCFTSLFGTNGLLCDM